MRHTDACDRCERQPISMPQPSAHATAVLIGDTWLTTATVRPAARTASSSNA